MGSQLIFGFESHVAFGFTGLVGADYVGSWKMDFKTFIRVVVNIFVVISAKMACQVISWQVIKELQIIEVKFFTEIAVWMWQHLTMPIIANVTELDVLS